MCDEDEFNFTDFNLDFLDLTLPTSNIPFEPSAIGVDDKCTLLQLPNSPAFVSLPLKQDLSGLSKRIAHTDELVRHIKKLENEQNDLLRRLDEFQSSANQIQRLYETEKKLREELIIKAEQEQSRCEQLDEELAQIRLLYDQLQAKWEEECNGPVNYGELAKQFVKLAKRLIDEKLLHPSERSLVYHMSKYCKLNHLRVPISSSTKRKRAVNVEKSVKCKLLDSDAKVKPTVTMCSQGTQHDDPRVMRSQGTQHFSVTTTRGTTTAGLVTKRNVGTCFPEPAAIPPFDEILLEMQEWDIVSPITPLAEVENLLPPPETTKIAQYPLSTHPTPELKTIGTCTFLCNIKRAVDYLPHMPTVKMSTSRPPSRLMYDGIKNEAPTPTSVYGASTAKNLGPELQHCAFEDLWEVFGQKLFALLQQPCPFVESRPTATLSDPMSQQDFYNLVRPLCVAMRQQQSNRPHSPLGLTDFAPCEQVMRPQARRRESVFVDAPPDAHVSTDTAHDSFKRVSVATSPIRVLNHSAPHNHWRNVSDVDGSERLQQIFMRKEYSRSAFQPHQRINRRKGRKDPAHRRRKEIKIAKRILKLLPKQQTSKRDRNAATYLLNRCINPHRTSKHSRNPSSHTAPICSPITCPSMEDEQETAVDFVTSLLAMQEVEQSTPFYEGAININQQNETHGAVALPSSMHDLFGSDTDENSEITVASQEELNSHEVICNTIVAEIDSNTNVVDAPLEKTPCKGNRYCKNQETENKAMTDSVLQPNCKTLVDEFERMVEAMDSNEKYEVPETSVKSEEFLNLEREASSAKQIEETNASSVFSTCSDSSDTDELIGFADRNSTNGFLAVTEALQRKRKQNIFSFGEQLGVEKRSTPAPIESKTDAMVNQSFHAGTLCTPKQDEVSVNGWCDSNIDLAATMPKSRVQNRKMGSPIVSNDAASAEKAANESECMKQSGAISQKHELAGQIDETRTFNAAISTEMMIDIPSEDDTHSLSKNPRLIPELQARITRKRGRKPRIPMVTTPEVGRPLLDIAAANSSPLESPVFIPKLRGRKPKILSQQNTTIVAETSSEATTESFLKDSVSLIETPVAVAKKRGRKPKSQACPPVLVSSPAVCKRSERLRAKQSCVEKLPADSVVSRLTTCRRSSALRSSATSNPAKESPAETPLSHGECGPAKTDGFSSDEERPLYICWDDGPAEEMPVPSNDCDILDVPAKYPILAESNLPLHHDVVHGVSSESNAIRFAFELAENTTITPQPTRFAVASPANSASQAEPTQLCAHENVSEAAHTSESLPSNLTVCCELKTEKHSHAPFTFTTPPASPTPAAEPTAALPFNTTPVEIPLELSNGYEAQMNNGALLPALVATHSMHDFRIVTGTNSAKKMLKTKKALTTQLGAHLTKYLKFAVVNHEAEAAMLVQTMEKVSNSHRIVIGAVVKVIQMAPRSSEEVPDDGSNLASVYLERLGASHQRIRFVLRHLQAVWPNFIDDLLRSIDSVLFNVKNSAALSLDEALNLTQLFIVATLNSHLPLPFEHSHPARLFVLKCIYFHEEKAPPMVYEILCAFPTVLPCREDRTYDRSDPLITVIQHRLMCSTYDMTRDDLCSKGLLSKLRFEYHFTPFSPEFHDVLHNLLEKLRAGKLQNLSYAFALLCKRLHPTKTLEIVHTQLIPIANEYYTLVLQSEAYDERTAALLDCISMVVKPLPPPTDVGMLLCIFSRFLNAVDRRTVQEGAVHAILRLQRFSYPNCCHALMNFAPTYNLHAHTRLMLRSFVHRKPTYFWRNLIA